MTLSAARGKCNGDRVHCARKSKVIQLSPRKLNRIVALPSFYPVLVFQHSSFMVLLCTGEITFSCFAYCPLSWALSSRPRIFGHLHCVIWLAKESSAGLTGILFSDRSENAYSALRIWQASGFTMGFASAKLLTIEGQLWILLGTVVLAAVFNLLVELNTQTKDQLMPCCSRSSRKGNFPTTSTPHNIKPDVHISDPPKSPSCSNILFTAYDGRRPSGWNVACDSSQGLPFNPAFALTDAILEEDRENDRGYSVAPQKRNSINPSRSYHQAMVHRANMEGLEDVDLSEVVVEGPSLLSPHRRESINPAVSYIEALQHAGIDD